MWDKVWYLFRTGKQQNLGKFLSWLSVWMFIQADLGCVIRIHSLSFACMKRSYQNTSQEVKFAWQGLNSLSMTSQWTLTDPKQGYGNLWGFKDNFWDGGDYFGIIKKLLRDILTVGFWYLLTVKPRFIKGWEKRSVFPCKHFPQESWVKEDPEAHPNPHTSVGSLLLMCASRKRKWAWPQCPPGVPQPMGGAQNSPQLPETS